MQNAMRKIGSVARHLRRARRFSVIFLLRFTLRSVNRWFCAWKVRLISSFAPYLSPLLSFLTSSFPTLPRRRILRCKIKRARALPRLRRGSVGKDEASRRRKNKGYVYENHAIIKFSNLQASGNEYKERNIHPSPNPYPPKRYQTVFSPHRAVTRPDIHPANLLFRKKSEKIKNTY